MTDHEQRTVTVSEGEGGLRADVFLSNALEISRSSVQRLLEEEHIFRVTSDNTWEIVPKKYLVQVSDSFFCELPDAAPYEVEAEDIPLDIRYEDDDVIVVNKPKGMVVHPAPGNETGTLVSALLFHCRDSLSGVGGKLRPGIVHRIDKNTTGLLAVAKNDTAHISLTSQLADHSMHRIYQALVVGHMKEKNGTIDLPIGRSPSDRKKMAVVKESLGRNAVTHYEVLEEYEGFSLVRFRLETGRTHQIRVHMSYLGHPILGDDVYGRGPSLFEKKHAALLEGQCLHAGELIFRHPRTGQEVSVKAEWPAYFQKLVEILRNRSEER